MNLAFSRATVSFNFLALVLALAAATRWVFALPGNMPWWEFMLTVGVLAVMVTLPFTFFLARVFEGGGIGSRYFVIVLNFLFSVFGGFALYYVLQGKPLDPLGMFVIGVSPVALSNAVYLIVEQE